MKTRLSLLCFTALCAVGCPGPSGAGYDYMGLRVSPRGAGQLEEDLIHCFTFPVLLGSRVEQEFSIERGLILFVSGDRDEAFVSTTGATDDFEGTFVAEELEAGATGSFDITSATSGESFTVGVQYGCQ